MRKDIFEANPLLTCAARAVALLAVSLPLVVSAQLTLAEYDARETELLESITQMEIDEGPYSELLIDDLTALSFLYEDMGNVLLAEGIIERIRSVIRANYGLYSLEQADIVRRLIERLEARGDNVSAWYLEQDLLYLAQRHPEDPRIAKILNDTGDRRIRILASYRAGEFPPEIELGCYYDETNAYLEYWTRGSRPITVMPGPNTYRNCKAGSASRARRALAGEAMAHFSAANQIELESGTDSDGELGDRLLRLARYAHSFSNPLTGRRSLLQLYDFLKENDDDLRARADILLYISDLDLHYAAMGGRNRREEALQGYVAAWETLRDEGMAQAELDALFNPDFPVVLPGYVSRGFRRIDEASVNDWMDVQFTVTADGRMENLEVLDSSTNTRGVHRRNITSVLNKAGVRPTIVNGELVDSPTYQVRFPVSD